MFCVSTYRQKAKGRSRATVDIAHAIRTGAIDIWTDPAPINVANLRRTPAAVVVATATIAAGWAPINIANPTSAKPIDIATPLGTRWTLCVEEGKGHA